MTAQTVYQKVVRLSLRSAANLSKRRVDELSSGIGELRQLLSCVVCCKLLVDPYAPKGKRCHHYVCRLCIRGCKRLMSRCRQCEDCSDFKTYEENRLMAIQLLCYKTLCVRLLQSSMFTQLAGLFPDLSHVEQFPRIRLPAKTTQEFIREGTNYDGDIRDSFLPQPDLPFLKNLPLSLPAETPPTTAATTPEMPYEQNLPEQLSITDIEMEAAATAEQSHFTHPLPLMPTGSRMGLRHLMLNQGSGSLSTEATSYTDHSWNDQVDLSAAVSMSSFPYVMQPTAASTPFDEHPMQELQIGQVVRIEESTQPALLAITSAEVELLPSQKRKLAQLKMEQEEQTQQLVLQEIASKEEELAYLENVSQGEDYLENISQDENYLENVSQEEAPLEIVSKEEASLEIVSQEEATLETASQEDAHLETASQEKESPETASQEEESPETVSQEVFEESGSLNTSRESVTEEIYKEIVSEELYQETSSQEATQQHSVAAEEEEIDASHEEPSPEQVKEEEEKAEPEEAYEISSSEESYTSSSSSEEEDNDKDTEWQPIRSKSNIPSVEQEPAKTNNKKVEKAASPAPAAEPAPVPTPVPEPVPTIAKTTHKKSAKSDAAKPSSKRTTGGSGGSSRRNAGKTKEKPPKPICRCGTSGVSVNPKTTCRNTRCPCYKSGNTCTNCHCAGCHNPHKMDYLDSDDELDELEPLSVLQAEKEQPMEATETPKEKVTNAATPTATPKEGGAAQGSFTLVPSNLQQSQHPLVLVQNEESGEYQGFNIFQGSVPIHPETIGFMRVQLQNNDPNSTIPQYAYVMPPPPVAPTAAATAPTSAPALESRPKPEAEQPQPTKKFKSAIKRSARLRGFPPRNTIDELVSGGSSAISNSAAGDRLSATDNAHSLFEEIMSGSDDL
ncbi:E3 ubiquitin-protein ligase msl-2 [Drosophila guanche]|uniref:Blast:E3 ubiquitin-protein ligase msl-2 n=1 Tax=Drosophila guanche TaxID=7266 RepID=A0A3B0JBW3_DROGU|nr:E3 ubiquitin-protein ligase msl-2 [Drosophila guanche]SPP79844.1 blast:E3 ubiquitin-protein ligase msl-2 [Drosophila guanche]